MRPECLFCPCERPPHGRQPYALVENVNQSMFQPIVRVWLTHRADELGRSDEVGHGAYSAGPSYGRGQAAQNKTSTYVDTKEKHVTLP